MGTQKIDEEPPPLVVGYVSRKSTGVRPWYFIGTEIALAACIAATMWCALITVIVSQKMRKETPEFTAFRNSQLALAATQATVISIDFSKFSGTAYVRKPYAEISLSYYALAFAGAAAAILALRIRFRRLWAAKE